MTKLKTTVNVLGTKLEIEKPDPQHECKYCGKKFVKESSLAVHLCEKKKRHQSKGDAGSRIGLTAYQRFFEMTQSGKARTFDDFVNSQYYTAFVKFGWFCAQINPINTRQFIEYVIRQSKKLDRWCSEKLYDDFLADWLLRESVDDALERAIVYADNWGKENSAVFCDLLRYGNANVLTLAIERGRISPWVIYSCDSGTALLQRMTEEQRMIVWHRIDPEVWMKKLASQRRDWDHAKSILEAARW